jgi:sugar O-acyltransferase (sialic acid O-acetyltransferase NeuD family)
MAEVLVWGSGGHGRVVADLAHRLGHFVAGYSDADSARIGSPADFAGRSVVLEEGAIVRWLSEREGRILALGVGDNAARLAMGRRLPREQLPPLAHPAATIAADVRPGPGTVVLAGAVINTSAEIGMAVIINSGAIVEHDAVIGDGAHVAPGAVLAGAVSLGEEAWVGANATVLPGVRIGARAIVGAGSVVLAEVAPETTVVGNPARRIR